MLYPWYGFVTKGSRRYGDYPWYAFERRSADLQVVLGMVNNDGSVTKRQNGFEVKCA